MDALVIIIPVIQLLAKIQGLILVCYISLKKGGYIYHVDNTILKKKTHPSDSDCIHGLRLSNQLKTIVGPLLHGCLTHRSDYCAFPVYKKV